MPLGMHCVYVHMYWVNPSLLCVIVCIISLLHNVHGYNFSYLSTCCIRASRNCDLFTLDKADLDTCLHFHKDLSSKIFRVANIRYQTLKSNVKAASTVNINNRRRMSCAIKSSGIDMEDIELGILGNDDGTSLDVETDNTLIPWFKYPLHFTISYQSYFIKFLSVLSILFNIALSVIIPYEVRMQ